MVVLMLGSAVAILMKYNNNKNNEDANLGNSSSNKVSTHLVGTVEITMLTNEFATTINANQEMNSKNSSYKQQQFYKITTAGRHSADTIAKLRQNNNNSGVLNTLPVTHPKRFDDEINTSNQRYGLNGHPTADEAFKMPAATSMSLTTADNSSAAALSSSEPAERDEGAGMEYTPSQQQEKQQGHGMQQNHVYNELVLHRHKRYLVFPEGSSFQMGAY